MSRIQLNDPDALFRFRRIFGPKTQERGVEYECQAYGKEQALGRNRGVGELLCIVAGLVSAGFVRRTSGVTADGAAIQRFQGSDHLVAAHCMPRNIRIDGRLLWDLTHPDSGRPLSAALQGRLRSLFAKTTLMRQWMNYADSCAEAKGLAETVTEAVRATLRLAHEPAKPMIRMVDTQWQELTGPVVHMDLPGIEQTYQKIYMVRAENALRAAIDYIESLVERPNPRTVPADWSRGERRLWADLLKLYLDAVLAHTRAPGQLPVCRETQEQIRMEFRM